MNGFEELYATGSRVDKLLSLAEARKPIEIYARLEFTPNDVKNVRGEFLGFSDRYDEDFDPGPEDPGVYYVAPEGKAILLFSKTAQ